MHQLPGAQPVPKSDAPVRVLIAGVDQCLRKRCYAPADKAASIEARTYKGENNV